VPPGTKVKTVLNVRHSTMVEYTGELYFFGKKTRRSFFVSTSKTKSRYRKQTTEKDWGGRFTEEY